MLEQPRSRRYARLYGEVEQSIEFYQMFMTAVPFSTADPADSQPRNELSPNRSAESRHRFRFRSSAKA